ncbi:hypothetical protein MBH78_19500 [Oceanimonas sp. NS1]|nr:hypothetical protein [Oceanimonas sp. NS1]
METLIEAGLVQASPITYEDFLPVSAAGIFQSNLGSASHQAYRQNASKAAFERALGCPVIDEFGLYADMQMPPFNGFVRCSAPDSGRHFSPGRSPQCGLGDICSRLDDRNRTFPRRHTTTNDHACANDAPSVDA